jgi:hypothetical protein
MSISIIYAIPILCIFSFAIAAENDSTENMRDNVLMGNSFQCSSSATSVFIISFKSASAAVSEGGLNIRKDLWRIENRDKSEQFWLLIEHYQLGTDDQVSLSSFSNSMNFLSELSVDKSRKKEPRILIKNNNEVILALALDETSGFYLPLVGEK